MITDTGAGQTNYCPNCEDQARRIGELERRQAQLRAELFALASTVSEYLLFTAKSTDLSKAYHSAIEVINATSPHSAALEWNQHVEWCRKNLVAKGSSVAADEPLYLMPQLKDMKK